MNDIQKLMIEQQAAEGRAIEAAIVEYATTQRRYPMKLKSAEDFIEAFRHFGQFMFCKGCDHELNRALAAKGRSTL